MAYEPHLLGLPNELILYVFGNFLELPDVWTLLQVSSPVRRFAMDTIQKRWKIEMIHTADSMMKIQCRGALIALEALSRQLCLHTTDWPLGLVPASPPTIPSHSPLVAPPPSSDNPSLPFLPHRFASPVFFTLRRHQLVHDQFPHPGDDDHQDEMEQAEGIDDQMMEEDEMEDDNEMGDEHSLLQRMMTPLPTRPPLPMVTVPLPLDPQAPRSHDNKVFEDLMRQEDLLHQRIIRGITSYKHKYVLIEDIDIRNRIRATVDVIFHHAVFVSAMTRHTRDPLADDPQLQHHQTMTHQRSMAAMLVRLMTRLDAAFPSYCREITYTLADHIKAFLEYTGYKLLMQRPLLQKKKHLLEQHSVSPSVSRPLLMPSFNDLASRSPLSLQPQPQPQPLSLPPPPSQRPQPPPRHRPVPTYQPQSIDDALLHPPGSNSNIRHSPDDPHQPIPHPPAQPHLDRFRAYVFATAHQHRFDSPLPSTTPVAVSPTHPSHLSLLLHTDPLYQAHRHLPLTLHSMAACFDLMGASFVGKILGENHVECAIQRSCELLTESLVPVKKALLSDLLEDWLSIKRGLVAGELCRLVRTEIQKCDRPASSSSMDTLFNTFPLAPHQHMRLPQRPRIQPRHVPPPSTPVDEAMAALPSFLLEQRPPYSGSSSSSSSDTTLVQTQTSVYPS